MRDVVHADIDIGGRDPDDVWPALHDVDLLAGCSSAVDGVVEIDPGAAWTATLNRRVGRFGISVPLRIDLASDVPGDQITIRGEGLDRKMGSRLTFDAQMRVSKRQTTGAPYLSLRVDYELTGQVASMGSAVVRRHAAEMVGEFAENLARALIDA